MSQTVYNTRVDYDLKDTFDEESCDVNNNNCLNLSIGAPGPDLLERCCSIFEKATEHRMVIIV